MFTFRLLLQSKTWKTDCNQHFYLDVWHFHDRWTGLLYIITPLLFQKAWKFYHCSWVPVANRSGARTSGNVSTPPLPSLTSSNTSAGSDAKSPHHRNNTIPRYSSRDMSSSGNASNMTSPVGTGDENTLERDRRHSWHEIQEEINSQSRYSPRNISVARHNPRTGHTETILMENQPNGDSGKRIARLNDPASGLDNQILNPEHAIRKIANTLGIALSVRFNN